MFKNKTISVIPGKLVIRRISFGVGKSRCCCLCTTTQVLGSDGNPYGTCTATVTFFCFTLTSRFRVAVPLLTSVSSGTATRKDTAFAVDMTTEICAGTPQALYTFVCFEHVCRQLYDQKTDGKQCLETVLCMMF